MYRISFPNICRGLLLVVLLLTVSCNQTLADDTAPTLNNGQKWRIAYYQGGPIPFYANIQKETIKELMNLGWISKSPLPEELLPGKAPYWNWLSTKVVSNYLEFLPENGYSASWNPQKREQVRADLLKKLQSGKIDLVIAMGTWAGEALINDQHSTPTLLFSASNFHNTGILKSLDDSGYDHVSAMLDPTFFERQLRMYHRLTGFQTLGVAYEDTEEGLHYSSISTLEKVSKEQNFTLNRCKVIDTTEDREKSRASCLSCYKELAENSDAIFITSLLCADEEIDALAELFKEKKVTSYSVFGSEHAKKGIMLTSSAAVAYREHGKRSAHKIAKVLSGTKPRSIPQVTEIPLFLSINTATAKAINFTVPESIRRIAHEVYEK
jgi:ABC-type uncharacterized transport system substrate-binding protein